MHLQKNSFAQVETVKELIHIALGCLNLYKEWDQQPSSTSYTLENYVFPKVMEVWKMIFLSKQVIFRFHGNFQGVAGFFLIKYMIAHQKTIHQQFKDSSTIHEEFMISS